MYKYIYFLFMALLVIGCEKETPKVKNKVNEMFKIEAVKIFGDKLKDEKVFSSYSSYKVIYEIDLDNYTLNNMKNILNNGWVLNKKLGQSFIFCKDKNQLEIVPPRKMIGNESLEDGDIARQLENTWNIIFHRSRQNSYNVCSK